MVYSSDVQISARIEVAAKNENEAAKLIFSRLADMAKGLIGCSFGVSGIDKTGKEILDNENESCRIASEGGYLKQQYGTFGKFLTQFMIDNRIGPGKIGDLIGISNACVTKWASGKCIPKLANWRIIADKISELSGNHYRSDDILAFLQAQDSASRKRQ